MCVNMLIGNHPDNPQFGRNLDLPEKHVLPYPSCFFPHVDEKPIMKITLPFFLFTALLFPIVCFANAAEELNGGERQINKIIFLGNSITNHGPAPEIGWTGSWGMAASAADKDYAHLVVQGLCGKNATPPEAKFINIATFERNYETYDAADQLKQAIEFAPEMIVVAIGENVSALTTEQAQASFKSGLLKLLAAFKEESSPAIIIRSSFWADAVKDNILKEVAKEVGGTYVDISTLGKDESNYVRSERDYQHEGVAAHPGDKGMKAIAEAILAKIKGHAYYVASDGDDTADGLSPSSAWKTLVRVSQADIQPGDSVLFRRGDEFRGQLRPQRWGKPGQPVTYGAYGEGPKPILLGSVSRNRADDWRHEGGNLWSTSSVTEERDGSAANPWLPSVTRDVGNIIFNNGEKPCGFKRWKESDLKEPGDFWYDRANNRVKLVCETNPAEAYNDIEFALRRHLIDQTYAKYVIYEDLTLLYAGAHGIGGTGPDHFIARRLDVGFIGGGDQYGDGEQTVRFGNGIEFWDCASNCLVEDCRIWQCYDAALTPQGNGGNKFRNITYRNNTIWNCEFSFEYWNRPETAESVDIAFENNRCYSAGGSWGHRQRPDPGGRHLCIYSTPAAHKNFRIENNLFYGATDNAFYAPHDSIEHIQEFTIDKNRWYQPEGVMIRLKDRNYTMDQFGDYQKSLGMEPNSTLAEPGLEVPPCPPCY